jgi:hypothetical protein
MAQGGTVGLSGVISSAGKVGSGTFASSAITLGVHCATNNGASSVTTVVCGPMTPTAGSTIYCDMRFPFTTLTSVADNVNPGVYQPAFTRLRASNFNDFLASYYKENVSGAATTITLTYGTAGANAIMACKEIQGVPRSYALDSSVMQSRAVNGTNPTNPNNYTPFANNEIVLSDAYILTGAVTAGTSFTLLDQTATLNPEYWLQTTATATTGAFVDASTTDSAVGMAAFGPNVNGYCDSTMIIPWDGGSNGVTPTTTTLQNSTHGGQAQPNADGIAAARRPGWVIVASAADITYTTAAYSPLATTRNCPFYSGSGTGAVGLDRDTVAVGGNVAYYFETAQPRVTLGACISTTTPVTNTGTADILHISGGHNTGNPDYALLQWNSGGTAGSAKWGLESPGATTATSTTNWVQGTWYWIRLEYNQASLHKLYIYTFSGSKCSGTPTLQETLTKANGAVAGGGPADNFGYFIGGSMTYASGTHWYIGASAGDILYGSALMP